MWQAMISRSISSIRRILTLAAIFLTSQAQAETITGRVINIADGDTLTILDESRTTIKVRLAAIDAPEKAQAYGQRGKQGLWDLCFGKPVIVKVMDTDRYGRTVGEVACAGTNANEAMIERGMAWVYRKYAKGHGHLFPIEDEARQAKRGLWVDPDPVPPWEWRKAMRAK